MRYKRRRYRYRRNNYYYNLRRHLSNSKYAKVILTLILLSLIINLQLRLLRTERNVPKNFSIEKIADFNINQQAFEDIVNYSDSKKLDYIQVLTHFMIQADFDLMEYNGKIVRWKAGKENKEFKQVYRIYEMVLKNIVYFPIPENLNSKDDICSYEDTFGESRSYGGERQHEGTDLIDPYNKRGYHPIISITDGIIEKVGWLEKGGYRVGVRAPSGAYFYYAHLYSYADGIKEGVNVKAGQLLGFMGDSGYSKVEGTVGKFPVHLHLGISIPLRDSKDEFWINPYWILKYLEKNKLKSWY